MPHGRLTPLKLTWCRVLLIAALPLACAVEVQTDPASNSGDAGSAGTASGGSGSVAGSSAGGMLVVAGSTSSAGATSSPFGGTSSSGGKASGGASGAAGSSSSGGKDGSGGSAVGGAGGSSAGGTGSGGAGAGCACPKTVMWVDNTTIMFSTGDCVDVGGKKYLYTGKISQTYANIQCNPTKQETWCTDSGNDYKFMLCP